jgi:amidase
VESVTDASALEIAERIRKREVSSEEVTRAHLERVHRLNPALTAFVRVFEGPALRAARACDRAVRRAEAADVPALFGVPTGVKDLDLVRWSVSQFGSRAFKLFFSPVDGPAAKRMRAEGMVILGKLATSELGAMPVTEPDIHPPTRNPWSLDHTSGGSSGGSGSAVAARMLPIAHASDGGGSVRIPAALCGVFGVKPSRGQLVNPYRRKGTIDISTLGPISRTVDDAAAFFDVLALGPPAGEGAGGRNPWLAASRRAPGRLRVRFTTRSPICATDAEIAAATERSARLIADLGHEVDEGEPPSGSLEEFLPIWERQLATIPVFAESSLQPITRWLRAAGRNRTPEQVAEVARTLAERVAAWFGDADVWITPTVACAPPRVGELKGLPPDEAFARAANLGVFTAMFNVSGQPAASVPMGTSNEGLPIGVQLAGRLGRDHVVLQLARQIEAARPWRDRVPPSAA